MKCLNCKAPNDDNARYCAYCGCSMASEGKGEEQAAPQGNWPVLVIRIDGKYSAYDMFSHHETREMDTIDECLKDVVSEIEHWVDGRTKPPTEEQLRADKYGQKLIKGWGAKIKYVQINLDW